MARAPARCARASAGLSAIRPSASPRIRSPGLMLQPPASIGPLSTPPAADVGPSGLTARANTGKSVQLPSWSMSRTAPSTTSPAQPLLRRCPPRISPIMAKSVRACAAITTSPPAWSSAAPRRRSQQVARKVRPASRLDPLTAGRRVAGNGGIDTPPAQVDGDLLGCRPIRDFVAEAGRRMRCPPAPGFRGEP